MLTSNDFDSAPQTSTLTLQILGNGSAAGEKRDFIIETFKTERTIKRNCVAKGKSEQPFPNSVFNFVFKISSTVWDDSLLVTKIALENPQVDYIDSNQNPPIPVEVSYQYERDLATNGILDKSNGYESTNGFPTKGPEIWNISSLPVPEIEDEITKGTYILKITEPIVAFTIKCNKI